MPGFHKHEGKNTYYFVPRQHGDYHTYQIKNIGQEMVLDRGYVNGERVSWDIFYTLNDLGLLYFKESDADPQTTAPDPDDVDYDAVSDLSVKQRCKFILHILRNYKLADIKSDVFIELLLSVADAPLDVINPIVDRIVMNTPYDREAIIDVTIAEDHSPIILACPIHYWYNQFRNDETVRSYLNVYNCECIHHDGEYGYYVLFKTDDTTMPTVTLPKQLYEVFQADQSDDGNNNILERMTFALESRLLKDALGQMGNVVATGVDTLDDATLAIVPVSANTAGSVGETSMDAHL